MAGGGASPVIGVCMQLFSKTSTDSSGFLNLFGLQTEPESRGGGHGGLLAGASNEMLIMRQSGGSDHDVWEMGKPKGSSDSVGVWLAESDSRQVLLT